MARLSLVDLDSCCTYGHTLSAGRGWVDLADVVSLGNALDELIVVDDSCGQAQADVDSDGDINEADYNLLYDVVAGVGP